MLNLNRLLESRTLLTTLLASALLNFSAMADPTSVILGPEAPAPTIASGELLLTELNCIACHQVTGPVKARLVAKLAPRLGDGGLALTPQFLRAFINNPARVKPGSTMPDLLHAVPEGQKAETVDALVHFLLSTTKPLAGMGVGADSLKIHQGLILFHQIGCVACHAPQDSAAAIKSGSSTEQATGDFTQLNNSSVPLGNLSIKTTVPELAKFLLDPLKVRPSGRMPSLNLTEGEANALAMYLLREQAAKAPGANKRISGLSYEYFEGSFASTAKLDLKKLKSSGTIDTFQLTPKKQTQNIGFRFTGFIHIPKDGSYTFYTYSDDGSRLDVDGKPVVDNDAVHGPQEKSGTVDLRAGDHIIQVAYFNAGAGAELKVSIAGAGLRKQEIPGSMLSTDQGTPMEPLNPENFVLDPAKVIKGKELFASIGCAACHQVGSESTVPPATAKSLAALNPSSGCLSEFPGKEAAKYQLSNSQKVALQKTLSSQAQLAQPRSPQQSVLQTMAALNCFACHSRDGSGGPNPLRAEYFTVLGEADLGDEGRIPPHLTKVGNKLRPEWTREVLTRKGAVRPYMATRMPQFGTANVEFLATAFEASDSAPSPDSETDQRDVKYGRKLVGTEGLACISCHTFAERKSLGIPALDLTLMSKRLKKDWFHRYLLDPASLRPGTRMPTFWPEGVSARKDILAGDTTRQIDSIWAYLSKAKEVGLPVGLIQGRAELVAADEAIMYRNFIDGGGSRAIGVGYPEKANLAFDANDLRLAMIWQGPFIDAARHQNGRGEGFEKPLGYNLIKMPPGMPFAVLDDPAAKWPDTGSRSAGYKMEGYRLDDKRRPAFHYSYQGVEIEDYPIALPGDTDPSLRR
ncbi:MAG TPA: PA14 domain-containing protein, partial [Candidatus Saccharimonadales bacterium]|nr:PA14 domain-containing protein [Candidatus Saccharimonadales bacterium]